MTTLSFRSHDAPDAWENAARIFEPSGASNYLYDPRGFITEFVQFGEGEGPTFYQEEILDNLVKHGREAVRGPHGLGKTTLNAWAVIWFAITREAEGIDWKVATTAGAWRQLEHYLWPEIHKWVHKIDWEKLNLVPWRNPQQLQNLLLKLRHGRAFAIASTDEKKIEGVHADAVLYIFDESKAIAAKIFDAAEGAFSGSTPGSQHVYPEAYALACSTPGPPEGRFYEIHKRKPGLEDWHVRHVQVSETIAAGRVTKSWVDQRRVQWGEDSALFQNRVLGEFHASSEDNVLPLSWVEAANERWLEWDESGRPQQPGVRVHGCDVARGGRDLTVFADRTGAIVHGLEEFSIANTVKIAKLLMARMHQADIAVVDVIGVGAGVVDYLRTVQENQNIDVIAYNASRKSRMRDRSGEFGFVNQRAAMWWTLREMLDPAFEPTLALPPDDELIGELTAPRWWVTAASRIQIESKDDVRARIGRSTDHADAVAQTLLTDADFNDTERPDAADSVFQYTEIDEDDSTSGVYAWEESSDDDF